MENCSFLSGVDIDEVIDAEITRFIAVIKTYHRDKILSQTWVKLVIISSNHLTCFVLFIHVILRNFTESLQFHIDSWF